MRTFLKSQLRFIGFEMGDRAQSLNPIQVLSVQLLSNLTFDYIPGLPFQAQLADTLLAHTLRHSTNWVNRVVKRFRSGEDCEKSCCPVGIGNQFSAHQ